jgi:predicted nucleic acid-binding protein
MGAVEADLARTGTGRRPVSTADAQIAAICGVHDATLVTRNIDDFDATGVALVDPRES